MSWVCHLFFWALQFASLNVRTQTKKPNHRERYIIYPQILSSPMFRLWHGWMNKQWRIVPNTLTNTHSCISTTYTALEEFNRPNKSVISTTQAPSEQLLELLIELGLLEHTHTHSLVWHQTPVQFITPVFLHMLFTVRCDRLLQAQQEALSIISHHVDCRWHQLQAVRTSDRSKLKYCLQTLHRFIHWFTEITFRCALTGSNI